MVRRKLQQMKEKRVRLLFLKDFSLMLALFFNPFGFDAVQYSLIQWTGDLWKANFIMYCIAASFFGLYLYFTRSLNKNEKTSD
jgi:hypothetical protein